MHALLLTVFWILVAATVIGGFNVMDEHPRTREINIGVDLVSFILNLAMTAWTAYILWGK